MLRFVAAKTERTDPRITAMMDLLLEAARGFEANGVLHLSAQQLPLAARAFAGVAAFLQQRILPSAVAAGNATGESQVRWAIEIAMTSVNSLLTGAATIEDAGATLTLDGQIDR
ncbi:hypothetical protein CWS72_09665 [Telmatospirillum siberiense]|uniref:Uncharacterized protein n=2 Tax=Telmatospirillum siberiense TaxID=382514 RepID=A0A2N3PWX9_9PROT|nr:hypothetical protein CWS72_09665 [Telmatospirillum siberiense]